MKSKQIRLPFLNEDKWRSTPPSRSLSLPSSARPESFSPEGSWGHRLIPRSLHRWYYATHRYPGKKDRQMHMAWRCTESPINSPVSISLLGNGAVNSSTEILKKRWPQTEEGKERALANLKKRWAGEPVGGDARKKPVEEAVSKVLRPRRRPPEERPAARPT
jgi:hypothetical protein